MTDRYQGPRYGGVPTFMRWPWVRDSELSTDIDAAFLGVPWDSDSGYRSGARFGPRALRTASSFLNPYNPHFDIDFRQHRLVDADDVFTVPGELTETHESIENRISELLDADVVPVIGGGNHGITLPALRAVGTHYPELSVLHFDAHSDLWHEASRFRQYPSGWCGYAIEEGLFNPSTSIRVGDRGRFPDSTAESIRDESGIPWISTADVRSRLTEAIAAEVRDSLEGQIYVTIDLDVFDPAFVPAVSTPSPSGLIPSDVTTILQRLSDLDIVGIDVVELCPQYASDGNRSALTGAGLLADVLALALS